MKMFFSKNIGWISVFILVVLPISRWLVLTPLKFRFLDINATLTSFGQIAGLAGMSLFSINLILASRLKFLDRYFFGMNNAYNQHRAVGTIAFSLLALHPLFLVVKYFQISTRAAALFLVPSGNGPITYGIIAFFFLMALLVTTFYIPLKYNHWKLTHKFMVAAFIFAILHTLFITSDISRDNVLKFYILGLATFGLAGAFWRAFLSKYLNANLKYRVAKISNANAEIIEIEAEPMGKPMAFVAGQFVFVSFKDKNVSGEAHPFSISSAPPGGGFKLVIKALGDFTRELKNLAIGAKISVEGPFGCFSYKNATSKNQIWIAGGIGITPFLSMASSLKGDEYKIDLYYCTSIKQEAVYLDRLEKISSQNKNFKSISWCSNENGRVSGQQILEQSRGLGGKDIFICGPPAFMEGLEKQFRALGVNKNRINKEQFKFL